MQSLLLELLLGILIEELPLVFHVLQNSPAHDLRFLFLVQNKLCVLLKSINEFLVINIVEALSNVKHFFGELFGINILIQPFFNSCLLDYHVFECLQVFVVHETLDKPIIDSARLFQHHMLNKAY